MSSRRAPARRSSPPACRGAKALLAEGIVVISAGGGGVPVIRRDGRLSGVEAVVDKDFAAALLARSLGADALLLLTDVPGILRDPRAEHPEVVREADAGYLHALDLPAGSMRPKAEAAARFAASGGRAAIGALDEATDLLAGEVGTQVLRPARPVPTTDGRPG